MPPKFITDTTVGLHTRHAFQQLARRFKSARRFEGVGLTCMHGSARKYADAPVNRGAEKTISRGGLNLRRSAPLYCLGLCPAPLLGLCPFLSSRMHHQACTMGRAF